jgi:NADH-quinone oxidoreductase subunit H
METILQFLATSAKGWPEWLQLSVAIAVPILFILGVFPLIFAYTTLVERKALGRVQNRYGPNRVGRWGLLQPIADGLKILIKEDIVPRDADKFTHFLAPVIAVIPSLLLFAIVPVGVGLVPVNLRIGILFAFAISTASVLALFMGGWASRNKFSLLGAMRAVAQVVSYEVPMVLAAVAVVMATGSLSTLDIVQAQAGGVAQIGGWFVFQPWGFVAFVLFLIGAMAESARTPFDIPEAESEIIAGYHTEYSGFKFALFQMGEYLAAIAMAGITVTMFLGGPLGPGCHLPYIGLAVSMFWFFSKLALIILLNIWIRGTWPRVRVDQLMAFAWKILLPMSILNILVVGIVHYMTSPIWGWLFSAMVLLVAFLILVKLTSSNTIVKRTYRYST